jgi:hypothetical protein
MPSFAVCFSFYPLGKKPIMKLLALRPNFELFVEPNYLLEIWVPKQGQRHQRQQNNYAEFRGIEVR